jgi:hypothetical protein
MYPESHSAFQASQDQRLCPGSNFDLAAVQAVYYRVTCRPLEKDLQFPSGSSSLQSAVGVEFG